VRPSTLRPEKQGARAHGIGPRHGAWQGRARLLENTCIFCRIAQGDVPSIRVLENEHVIAIRDVNPQAPVHVLVLPRKHIAGLTQLPADDPIWNYLVRAVQDVAQREQLSGGFRTVVNDGEDGGQTVPHLHLHVLGGRAMNWPPG